MKLRITCLVLVMAAAYTVALLVPEQPDSYLVLEQRKRPTTPTGEARRIMQHARNTRSIPINAELTIHRVAPGSPNGPVDLHHQPWDWVDLYNRSNRDIPMEGYSLSDHPNRVRKYRFPAITIPAQSSCRVWLSGFESMHSGWSLTPTDAIRARGWTVARNDSMADRFTYMWLGVAAPETRPDDDPKEYQLQLPIRIDEPGRYGVWFHAGVQQVETNRIHVVFKKQKLKLTLENRGSLYYTPLKCPLSEDGYWDLTSGEHVVFCTVGHAGTLINQVVMMRYGEPFGQGKQDLHAPFKLKQSGEFIGLFDPKGVVIDHVNTPDLQTGWMAVRDLGRGRELRIKPVLAMDGEDQPPPQPHLDVPPGAVEAETVVHITCKDPNAVLRYTLNGELPRVDSQQVISGIRLMSNTVLRTRAFHASGSAGAVAEASYWIEPIHDLPILSAIVEPDHLYDYSLGILYNTSIRGLLSERRCHLTLIETHGGATAAVGGMRIQGRSSRKTPTKRNFRFVQRKRYGSPVWPGTIFGGEGPPQSRSMVAIGSNFVRHQLAHELMDLALVRSPRRRPVRLFVNGNPFGLYLLLEDVQDPMYLESTFGHLDLDVIKEKTFQPVKWGSRTTFDKELLPWVAKSEPPITYETLSSLMDVNQLCRWWTVVQFAGIDDSGQGYYVRDYHAQGPPWTIINWDFDHAFTLPKNQGFPLPQGFRSSLLVPVKNASAEFQKKNLFPSRQHLLNHVLPLMQLPNRTRELMAMCEPFLDEEFEAHLNQRCFRQSIPDRNAFMATHYHDRSQQLLSFVDTRLDWFRKRNGDRVFGGPPHVVRVESLDLFENMIIDGWPARQGYVGHYYEGTELSIAWKDPEVARPVEFVVNGVARRLTELHTNVTEDLDILIQGVE